MILLRDLLQEFANREIVVQDCLLDPNPLLQDTASSQAHAELTKLVNNAAKTEWVHAYGRNNARNTPMYSNARKIVQMTSIYPGKGSAGPQGYFPPGAVRDGVIARANEPGSTRASLMPNQTDLQSLLDTAPKSAKQAKKKRQQAATKERKAKAEQDALAH